MNVHSITLAGQKRYTDWSPHQNMVLIHTKLVILPPKKWFSLHSEEVKWTKLHFICRKPQYLNHWGRPFHKWKMFSADPSYSANCFHLMLGHGFPLTQQRFFWQNMLFFWCLLFFYKLQSEKVVFVYETVTITLFSWYFMFHNSIYRFIAQLNHLTL